MLPPYGTVYGGGMVHFDEVEVEKRNDINSLQPDLCGVVRDKKTNIAKRLWVEIMVTHAIGPEKRELIRKNGISCIEINMSRFMSMQVTREDIVKFLLTDVSSREWTNNPLLEEKRQKQMECARAYNDVRHKMKQSYPDDEVAYDIDIRMKQREYLMQHPDECIVNTQYCRKCKYHSTRQRILEEVKRRHLPSWVSEALEGDLLYWTYDNISFTVNYHQCYRVEYDGYFRLLPTSSPDVHGMIVSEREIKQNNLVISFLTDTVPGLIALEGMTCREVKKWLDRTRKENKQYLVCGKAEVVKRKRRRNK